MTTTRTGNPKTVVVAGAGISGLATAYYIRNNAAKAGLEVRVLVIEKDARIGGKLGTDKGNGFIVEMGPDSVFASDQQMLQLFRDLGLEGRIIHQSTENQGTYILKRGAMHKLPEGMAGMLPTKLLPLLATPLISPQGKLRAALEVFVPRSIKYDESIASFVRRRFGGEVYDAIAEPLCGVVYAVNPEHASVHRTLPYLARIEAERRSVLLAGLASKKGREGSPPQQFVSFRGGMSELVVALADSIGTDNIMAGTAVEALYPVNGSEGRYAVRAGGKSTEADAVVLAVPAYELSRLAAGIDKKIAVGAGTIKYSTLAIVTLAYGPGAVDGRLRGNGVLVPCKENRSINAITISSNKWAGRAPEGHSLLRCYFNDSYTSAHVSLDDTALVLLAREELNEIAGIREKPLFSMVQRWERGMPIYSIGSSARTAAIENAAKSHPGFFAVGAWKAGIGVPRCIADARTTAERVIKYLKGENNGDAT